MFVKFPSKELNLDLYSLTLQELCTCEMTITLRVRGDTAMIILTQYQNVND